MRRLARNLSMGLGEWMTWFVSDIMREEFEYDNLSAIREAGSVKKWGLSVGHL